jgi:hypothetical protein
VQSFRFPPSASTHVPCARIIPAECRQGQGRSLDRAGTQHRLPRYGNPLGLVAFNTAEAWSRDVSGDIANEVLDRAYDADDTLTEGTERFNVAVARPTLCRRPLGRRQAERLVMRRLHCGWLRLAAHMSIDRGAPKRQGERPREAMTKLERLACSAFSRTRPFRMSKPKSQTCRRRRARWPTAPCAAPWLRRVSGDIRTGLCSQGGIPPGNGLARPETGAALLARSADSARQRPHYPASPAAKPRKVKGYSDGAGKPQLRGTAWWGW